MNKKTNTQKQEIVTYNTALEGLTYKDEGATKLLKNRTLAKHVDRYARAITGIENNQWTAVKEMGAMADKNLIKKDFGSDARFAEFIGSNQAMVNKMKRLSRYAELLEERVTVSAGFELLVLGDKVPDFIAEHEVSLMTVKEIREAVKDFNKPAIEDKSEGGEGDEGGKGKSLKDLDDTNGEELFADFSLIYIDNDAVAEATFNLSESQSERIAEVVTKELKKMGVIE